jgi:outer membrane lipoprotein-sorting protein
MTHNLSLVLCLNLLAGHMYAADIRDIVRQGTAAIHTDWDADPKYAYIEKDVVVKNGKTTSKTSQVLTIEGSDYFLPVAIDDNPLPPERREEELRKLRAEVRRRKNESASARRRRLGSYQKQRDENGALLLDFPNAFTFELLREETEHGRPAYVVSASPKSRTGPMSRAAKVLAGMTGTLWVDKDTFQTFHAECGVVSAVPIYGILARVLPGTHIEFEMTPVTASVWLVSEVSMSLNLSKLLVFNSTQVTRSTYSDYRLNEAVLEELLKP